MFLIEYENGCFVNAELIDWVDLKKKPMEFTVLNDTETLYKVTEDYYKTFLNNLQSLNNNISNIETRYKEINKG